MMIASEPTSANDAPTMGPTTPDPPEQTRLSKDEVFHLLQNERRRLALEYLRGAEGTVKMRDVAEQVAAWEHDTTVAALSSDQRQRVYIPLYQNHLPKLDKAGVIEYNQSRGIVERTPVADQLEPYLLDDESSDGSALVESSTRDDRWPAYYLATSVVSAVLLGGAALGTPIVSGISTLLLGMVIVLAFSTLSLAQVLPSAVR